MCMAYTRPTGLLSCVARQVGEQRLIDILSLVTFNSGFSRLKLAEGANNKLWKRTEFHRTCNTLIGTANRHSRDWPSMCAVRRMQCKYEDQRDRGQCFRWGLNSLITVTLQAAE